MPHTHVIALVPCADPQQALGNLNQFSADGYDLVSAAPDVMPQAIALANAPPVPALLCVLRKEARDYEREAMLSLLRDTYQGWDEQELSRQVAALAARFRAQDQKPKPEAPDAQAT